MATKPDLVGGKGGKEGKAGKAGKGGKGVLGSVFEVEMHRLKGN